MKYVADAYAGKASVLDRACSSLNTAYKWVGLPAVFNAPDIIALRKSQSSRRSHLARSCLRSIATASSKTCFDSCFAATLFSGAIIDDGGGVVAEPLGTGPGPGAMSAASCFSGAIIDDGGKGVSQAPPRRPDDAVRVEFCTGDLQQPWFGLGSEQFQELGRALDVVKRPCALATRDPQGPWSRPSPKHTNLESF